MKNQMKDMGQQVFEEFTRQKKLEISLKKQAVHVFNEIGLFPRELLKQRNELLIVLQEIVHEDDDLCECPTCKLGKSAIKKITKKA